jgi:hypothetical protein
MGQICGKD